MMEFIIIGCFYRLDTYRRIIINIKELMHPGVGICYSLAAINTDTSEC